VRPVNLIPPERRRGEQAPSRTGPIAYALVGVLCVALVGVVALVLTNNRISDREAQAAELTAEESALRAEADRLSGYTAFRDARLIRLATVKSLADSRFDWERVMRELSLVLPSNVWLTSLSGSVSPEVSAEGSSESSLRGGIAGPALSIDGCATGQDAVAGFITALRDIDGVTRVGFESSELPERSSAGSSTGGGSNAGGDECRTRSFIAQFKIVVAFDAAPVPNVTESAPTPTPAPAPQPADTSGGEATPTSSTAGEGG
jgi:Tfp pilus assembly protein PilN